MKLTKQFLLFIFAGGFAALINILTRAILSLFINFSSSVLISYLIGMIIAFLLTKKFVFLTKSLDNKKSFLTFSLVNLLAVFQTFFISIYFRNLLLNKLSEDSLANLLSHSIGVFFPVFTSFLGHKYLSFGKISTKNRL